MARKKKTKCLCPMCGEEYEVTLKEFDYTGRGPYRRNHENCAAIFRYSPRRVATASEWDTAVCAGG